MKAIRVAAYGSPDIMTLAELDDPVPGDNEVLIDRPATRHVRAAPDTP